MSDFARRATHEWKEPIGDVSSVAQKHNLAVTGRLVFQSLRLEHALSLPRRLPMRPPLASRRPCVAATAPGLGE